MALNAGTLKALQLYVHADEDDRHKVIETYTFTIQYSKNAADEESVARIELDSPGTKINVRTTNLSLQVLLRQIDSMCGELPNLPEKRFVSMGLLYLPGMGNVHEPEGFSASQNDTIVYATAQGWQRHVQRLKEMRSSFHRSVILLGYQLFIKLIFGRSTLEIASLASPATLRNEEVPFPTGLRYDCSSSTHKYTDSEKGSQAVQVLGDIRDTSERATSSPPTSGPARNLQEAVTTPLPDRQPEKSGIFTEGAMPHDLRPRNHKQSLRNRASSSNASRSTSFSAFSNIKREFEGMMRSETMSQGDTQSQYLGPPQVSASKSTCSPSKPKATLSPVAKSQVCLIPSKASEIVRDAQRLRKHAQELAKSKGKKTKKGHIVLCQCGLKEERGEMVSEAERAL